MKLLLFSDNSSPKGSVCMSVGGGGEWVEKLFDKIQFEQHFSYSGVSLTH